MNKRIGKVVIASGNAGKIAELGEILAVAGVECVPQSALDVEPAAETGATFEENALLKARHAALRTGMPAIADDSGLEVAALDGQPGVRSARFAGPSATDGENIDKLLAELTQVADSGRQARFRCVAVFLECSGDPSPLVASGEWSGVILTARRGSGGFGYDPVFLDPRLGKAAAELDRAEKNRVSHRGQAFRELARLLTARTGAANR